jgi:MFS family permease
LWASSGLSNLADGIVKVALPLVAIQLTRSPTLIAGMTFAVTLPWLLFALPAGALADRLDRRRDCPSRPSACCWPRSPPAA